jgi:putative redox protein
MDVIVTSGPGLLQHIRIGPFQLQSDEPKAFGGGEEGPTPYDLLCAALGACTSMTLRMYARTKGWPLQRVIVTVRHEKIHARDCADCETKEGKLDRVEREISLEGPLDDAQRKRLLEIADRCPVHRTLSSEVHLSTRLSP